MILDMKGAYWRLVWYLLRHGTHHGLHHRHIETVYVCRGISPVGIFISTSSVRASARRLMKRCHYRQPFPCLAGVPANEARRQTMIDERHFDCGRLI